MPHNEILKTRSYTPSDAQWLEELMNKDWGGLPLVINGMILDNPLRWTSKYGSIVATVYNEVTTDGFNED